MEETGGEAYMEGEGWRERQCVSFVGAWARKSQESAGWFLLV